jgi:methylenetetrahydrofolate--tRNA-(uracil-5-)-methyltransferase
MATGLVAGVNLARAARGAATLVFPEETAIGALTHHLATAPVRPFQPMNFNFGLLPPLSRRKSRLAKREAFAARALAAPHEFKVAAGDLQVGGGAIPAHA